MIASALILAVSTMAFTADHIAADNVTHALTASGHIVAVSQPMTLRGEYMTRDADGLMNFYDPTYVTTCSNDLGHTHWNVTGEVQYKDKDHVLLKNAWLKFCEVPVFWLPYLYYPLDMDNGFSWMPGYTSRWGGYLLTRYRYHLLGKRDEADMSAWLDGATRLDLRTKNGVGVGEDFKWGLGEYGKGKMKLYYAWDEDYSRYDPHTRTYNANNWGSEVNRERYAITADHSWDVTERDTVFARASYFSDSYMRRDFFRKSMFNWKSQWTSYENSGVFWEHVEDSLALGAEVSGRLNDFYGMTGRLPEMYIDVNPQPVFSLPVNYESQTRIGYLTRDAAEYGDCADSIYRYNPGEWAEYETFRLDTYHRLTAPFKTMEDVVSVVPRVAYRGTFWNDTGYDNYTGVGKAQGAGDAFRSILEGGVTFAGRGTAWVDDKWRHMVEPYADVLLQHAWMSGLSSHARPYVFDNLDASVMWEDQFAGRGRNLPYSYYGITPGLRNAWEKADDRGNLHQIVDFDFYAAFQFGDTSYDYGEDWSRKLAEAGKSNYGKNDCFVAPGARLRWTPLDDISLLAHAEYDSEHNTIASGDLGFQQKVTDNFKYDVTYAVRDFRVWDYSTTPREEFDDAKFQFIQVGFENQPLDWFAWSPYVRWDAKEGELECIGTWFDFLTDCLGFRFIVEYEDSYTLVDGYEYDEDWSFGFYIYLRAFGSGNSSIFH